MRRAVAASLLAGMTILASACGGGDTDVQMGLKRVALDLAFEADDASPQERVEALPPVLQTDFALTGNELVVRPAPPTALLPVLRAECPAAPAGAVPETPATVTIATPPLAGLYPTHNEGTLNVESGTFKFEGPYPKQGRVEIADVTDETAPPDPAGRPGARTIEFDHILPLGNTVTTTRFRVTAAELLLVRRHIVMPDAEFVFEPTPPVTMMLLGIGEGDTWKSGGTDLTTGATMVVEGLIVKREAVDVCGEMYDTYRVQSSERLVQLTGDAPFTQLTDDASTDGGDPNIYNIATQLGGLFLRVETHMTTSSAGLVVEEDNIATFSSVEPTAPMES